MIERVTSGVSSPRTANTGEISQRTAIAAIVPSVVSCTTRAGGVLIRAISSRDSSRPNQPLCRCRRTRASAEALRSSILAAFARPANTVHPLDDGLVRTPEKRPDPESDERCDEQARRSGAPGERRKRERSERWNGARPDGVGAAYRLVAVPTSRIATDTSTWLFGASVER